MTSRLCFLVLLFLLVLFSMVAILLVSNQLPEVSAPFPSLKFLHTTTPYVRGNVVDAPAEELLLQHLKRLEKQIAQQTNLLNYYINLTENYAKSKPLESGGSYVPRRDERAAPQQPRPTSLRLARPTAVKKDPNEILILLWDYPGGENWAGYGKRFKLTFPNYLGAEPLKNCSLSCLFTGNKRLIDVADAVMFEPLKKIRSEIPFSLHLPEKRFGQKWIIFGYETPVYFPLLDEPTIKVHMDIKMNYEQREKSDGLEVLPVTFTCMWGGGELHHLLVWPEPRTAEAPVVFMASNCDRAGAERRTQFVAEMMKYVRVDSYGKCLHNKDLPAHMQKPIYDDHGQSMKNKIEIFKQYKFVIAFENSEVEDYVSEKIMNVLQAGAVPIYQGAPNIHEWMPSSDSFILASDFPSAKELAEYINRLDQNTEEYNKHLNWKKHGFAPSFIDKYEKCIFRDSECRLCKRLKELNTASVAQQIPAPSLSLQLDGSAFVQIQMNSAGVKIGQFLREEFTIVGWIKMNGVVRDARVVDKNTPFTLDGFNLDIFNPDDNELRGFLRLCGPDGCFHGDVELAVGHWYHVACSYSLRQKKMSLMVNGKVDKDYPVSKPIPENSIPLSLGGTSGGANHNSDNTIHNHENTLNGVLDDISIWDSPLSAQLVQKMMYSRLKGDEPGLKAYWTFNLRPEDDVQAGATAGGGSTVLDNSVNAFHGRVVGQGSASYLPVNVKPLYHKPHFKVKIITS